MPDDNEQPQDPWREGYERHADGVRIVEEAASDDQIYTQKYVNNMREQFYKLGWYDGGAGRVAQPGVPPLYAGPEAFLRGAPKPTPTGPEVVHVRSLDVGDEGFVQPFAIVEHAETQTFAIDERFDVVKEADETHIVWIKRITPNQFSGRGPDSCRLWLRPPPTDMARVQYEKVAEATPE